MKKLLLPLILLIVGIGGGVGAGLFLSPPDAGTDAAEAAVECPEPAEDGVAHAEERPTPASATGPTEGRDYARLNNQFVVPVVKNEQVVALVVLSLSVEVDTGHNQDVFSQEPKLRDSFLQVLFDHANSGGFDGTFTSTTNMRSLRNGLRESARRIVGGVVHDVLIVEIVRQDV